MNWERLVTVAEYGFYSMCVATLVLLVAAFGIGAVMQAWTLVRERQRRNDNVTDFAAWVAEHGADAAHRREEAYRGR